MTDPGGRRDSESQEVRWSRHLRDSADAEPTSHGSVFVEQLVASTVWLLLQVVLVVVPAGLGWWAADTLGLVVGLVVGLVLVVLLYVALLVGVVSKAPTFWRAQKQAQKQAQKRAQKQA